MSDQSADTLGLIAVLITVGGAILVGLIQWIVKSSERRLEEHIASYERTNKEEHRELSSQIGKHGEALAKQGETLVKQAEALAHLRDDVTTQGESLANQSEALARQGETLVEQAEALAHLREDVATQGETLANQSEALAKQGETLAKQTEALAFLREDVAKQDQTLARQGEALTKHGETLSHLRGDVATQGETLMGLREGVAGLNALTERNIARGIMDYVRKTSGGAGQTVGD